MYTTIKVHGIRCDGCTKTTTTDGSFFTIETKSVTTLHACSWECMERIAKQRKLPERDPT